MHPIACEKVWAIVWACSGGLFVNIRNRMIFAYEGSPSLMLKQRESSIFQGKIPPKNMPRYKNLSEFSARNSGNMREKNGGMSGKLSQQELPHQRHTRTPCTETVPYYIPLICPLIHSLSSKTTLSHISIQNMSHSVYSHRKSQNRAFH